MATNFIHEGAVLDHTASADIKSGDVVIIGTIGGVAITDIANGTTGAVKISGVFSLAKVNGAITQGAKLYWVASSKKVSTTASNNTLIGVAATAAANGDARIAVLLNVSNG